MIIRSLLVALITLLPMHSFSAGKNHCCCKDKLVMDTSLICDTACAIHGGEVACDSTPPSS